MDGLLGAKCVDIIGLVDLPSVVAAGFNWRSWLALSYSGSGGTRHDVVVSPLELENLHIHNLTRLRGIKEAL
jgi:hypothetical protein